MHPPYESDFIVTCPECNGHWKLHYPPCWRCNGTGEIDTRTEREEREGRRADDLHDRDVDDRLMDAIERKERK
jgi:hypothetical protein